MLAFIERVVADVATKLQVVGAREADALLAEIEAEGPVSRGSRGARSRIIDRLVTTGRITRRDGDRLVDFALRVRICCRRCGQRLDPARLGKSASILCDRCLSLIEATTAVTISSAGFISDEAEPPPSTPGLEESEAPTILQKPPPTLGPKRGPRTTAPRRGARRGPGTTQPIAPDDPFGAIIAAAAADDAPESDSSLTISDPESRRPFEDPDAFVADPGVIGDYKLTSVLGVGGMGVVFLAEAEDQGGTPVAVKLLRRHGKEGEFAGRFQREVGNARRLEHRAIVAVRDFGAWGDHAFIVSEWVDGLDLSTVIQVAQTFPPERALTIGEELTDAVAAAHGNGVIHRDIKPANVIIDRAGEPHLTDFGLSRHQLDRRITRTGIMVGTCEYMSPEQVRGDREITARADVYGLGATLYEMLCLRPPFQGSAAQVITKILTEQPERPSSVRPGLPTVLDAVIERAMAKDPRDRFDGARALGLAIARARERARG